MNQFDNRDVILKVQNLKQYFGGKRGTKAVDDVSFEVRRGEVLGIVGESGCGKTTTGRIIMKIYEAKAGKVFFDNKCISVGIPELREKLGQAVREVRELKKAASKNSGDLEKLKLAQSRVKALTEEIAEGKRINRENTSRNLGKIQMIFQDPMSSLNPRMTVREIIAEGLIIRGVKDKKYIDRRVYEVLDMVGLLPEHAGRYPHEFSGGQRQRIGIARAIIMEPELIIADEPVSALDVSIQAQVINLLNELREKMGLTIIFIAHDLSVVKYFSDRIAVMYKGKIVELADADELFEHPEHPYTKELLSAIPVPDPHYEKNVKKQL